ncbi:MAG: DUF4388 domain-containing protein [Myxococcales bacterium]|nr:DUF4388 domain-containing protein [Myxococcales bacterium]MCB9642024.1 DUF4388 domain-containing protein [Myxococcales bacterium]
MSQVESVVIMEGSLKERPVTELFGLLARQQQTGMLTLKRWGKQATIEWHRGKVMHVRETPMPSSGSLGEMLLHIHAINPVQLEQALLQQERTLAPLGQILQRLFQCDPRLIRRALHVQSIEMLYSFFFWKSGRYILESRIEQQGLRSYDPIDVESLTLNAIPVVDSWPAVQKILYSSQVVLRRQVQIFPSWEEDGYSSLARELFELLEKERTFRELSILSGEGQYVAGRELWRLIQGGVVRVEPPRKTPRQYALLLLGAPVSQFAVWLIVSALLVGGGSFLLAFAPQSPLQYLRTGSRYSVASAQWLQTQHRWRSQRIRRALEIFRISTGAYPTQLGQLAKEGLIQKAMLYYPNSDEYYYRRLESGRYVLLPPLPR